MALRELLSPLRTGWWVLVLTTVLAAVAALSLSAFIKPQYASHSQLYISATGSGSTADAFQGGQLSQQRVTSYAQLLSGTELASRVKQRLNLNDRVETLASEVRATAVPNTVLINVTVTDPSPIRAQKIAVTLVGQFTRYVSELETPLDGGHPPVKVTVSQSPELPTSPSSPRPRLNAALGAVLGFLLGASFLVARVRLDRTVKDAETVVEMTGAPVIGTVMRDANLGKQHVVVRMGNSRAAEDYRQLRTNLQFLNVDQPPKVIMVSSALPSEGKTTVVVNLAIALADAGRTVTIVEGDLRRPKVTRYLGIVAGVGLTNVLAGTAGLDEVLQTYGTTAFKVIAAGPTPPNPGELLSSSHMFTLIDKLRGENDFVLVDAPPLLPVADSSGLAVAMDGVLLSVRYGSTTKEQLRQAAVALERVGAKTLGVILNIVPPKAELASAYGYGYSYGETG